MTSWSPCRTRSPPTPAAAAGTAGWRGRFRTRRGGRSRRGTGELRGTISHTECGPFRRARDAVPDDRVLSKPIGRYDCVAVLANATHNGQTVGKLGYAWVAALDFRRYTYVICRNSPAQGEAGRPLAFVRLDRACLATNSRAIGSGYIDPETKTHPP